MSDRPIDGELVVPTGALGTILFAHGSGSSRHSPRNKAVAEQLNRARLATLLIDLLTPEEAADRSKVFDIALLARRLMEATRSVTRRADLGGLPLGCFGASTGAAAALWAAAELGDEIAAIVSRGGRPDLAVERLPAVNAPTLLIVGSEDPAVLEYNREALGHLRCEAELRVVAGATHLFEESGTLETAGELAVEWFVRHFESGRDGPNRVKSMP